MNNGWNKGKTRKNAVRLRQQYSVKIHLSNALRAVLVCVFIESTEAPGSFLVARKSNASSSSKALEDEIPITGIKSQLK